MQPVRLARIARRHAGVGHPWLERVVAPYLKQKTPNVVLEKFEPRLVGAVYPHARLLPARTKVFIAWVRQGLKGFNA